MAYFHRYYYVYILKCSDHSYYSGITSNLDRRFAQHQAGTHPGSYTFFRRPVELVYACYFLSPKQAIAFEKQVKGWSRAKKEALIAEDWSKIQLLAQCRNSSHAKNRTKQ